jgi:recombination protein U
MNEGKKMEVDFKNSLPDHVYYLRLKDAAGWAEGEDTRFTINNEADCVLYDKINMYLLEFKSHMGKSIPFNCIRPNQIEGMMKAIDKGVIAGIVFNFRDVEETYFVNINCVNEYIKNADRKSFPLQWVQDNGHIIPQEKKRTRYRYNIQIFLDNFIRRGKE